MNETLIMIATAFTAGATVAIAYFSKQMHDATRAASQRESEFRSQVSDLYQAIVVATIVAGAGHSDANRMIARFNNMYKGQTPIDLTV